MTCYFRTWPVAGLFAYPPLGHVCLTGYGLVAKTFLVPVVRRPVKPYGCFKLESAFLGPGRRSLYLTKDPVWPRFGRAATSRMRGVVR